MHSTFVLRLSKLASRRPLDLCEGLEKIGGFEGCTSLKRVVIPSSIKCIGKKAFYNCTELKSVELREGLEKIMESAFGNCTSLEQISVPSSVKEIASDAFHTCKQLNKVEFCDGLGKIGGFEGCTSLKSILIPSSVTCIDEYAFYCCNQLKSVDLCGGLEEIMENAFSECRSLEQISVPTTVKEIGSYAFYKCEQLVNVVLCEGLEQIGSRAFSQCILLERCNIPSTVKQIKEDAFLDCPRLTAVTFFGEVEDLVTELSLTDWYNHGRKKGWLLMYSFLAQCAILERLARITARKWKAYIHSLLRDFPSIHDDKFNAYCNLISFWIDHFNELKDAVSVLELALWKSKLTERKCDLNSSSYHNAVKLEARYNCGATIIIPNVLSFLVRSDCVEDIAHYEVENVSDDDMYSDSQMDYDSYFSHSEEDFHEEMDEEDDDEDDSEDDSSLEG